MTVLDASALIAFLRGEPAEDEVERLLLSGAQRISATNLTEVIDQLVRVWGHSFDEVIERLYWLAADGLEVVDVDIERGALAGYLRARCYNRRDHAISLADCHALATALALDDSIATADPAVAAVAREEHVAVVALPDSTGRRPG